MRAALVHGKVSGMETLAVHDPESLAPSRDLLVARTAVEGALPGDAAHEAARARILALIEEHPDVLHRSCRIGHLTGSALVVDPVNGRILLLFHTKLRRWLQPGGHADGDGNLARVSLREASEETGIAGLRVVIPAVDLDVHEIHATAGVEADHLHLDVRHLVLAPADAPATGNHESEGMAWVTLEELPGYEPEPGLGRLARAGLALLDRLDGGSVPGWHGRSSWPSASPGILPTRPSPTR